MTVIGWIVLGAIGGWIGGLLVKGDEGMGVIMHIVLGIVGAAIAGFIVTRITNEDPMDGVFDISSLLTAIVGAVLLVVVVNMIQGRTRTGSGPI
ncbi:MAG: GlsB/YeaQ/YmgE family stress response membrane protein [Chloroflexota bacterium]